MHVFVVESQPNGCVIEMVKSLKKKSVFNVYPDLICTGIATMKDLKREMSEKQKKVLKYLFEQRGISVLQIKSLKEILYSGSWLNELEDEEKMASWCESNSIILCLYLQSGQKIEG